MKTFVLFVALATICSITTGYVEERQISLAGCTGTKQDIFFVLDSSGSVGDDNFNTMKTFVKSIIDHLDIGAEMTRIGVITYSRYPYIRLHLTDFYDKTQINLAVDNIPYIAGITETDLALQNLQNEGAKEFRLGVPHIAIVITDGQSFHPNRTSVAAAQVKNSGTVLFSVGIGEEVNTAELQSIATDPDPTHVFKVTDFLSLLNITSSLTARTCDVKQTAAPPAKQPAATNTPMTVPTLVIPTAPVQTGCSKTVADVMFVLDSSGSLGNINFNTIIQFVIDVVSVLDISPSLTRVGVITFSNYPTERITLTEYSDKTSLVDAITKIPYYPGNTETDKALDLLRLEGFKDGRPHAPDIAIVVTDGLSTNPDLTNTSAKKVKDMGINVFAIGIGDQISVPELNIISSDPNSYFVFNVSNYAELKNIEQTVASITCDVPKLLTTTTPTTPAPTVVDTTTSVPPSTSPPTIKLEKVATTAIPTIKTTIGPTPPSTTPVSCNSKVADVMFIIDNSGSIGSDDFQRVKDFVKQTITIFDVGTAFTRVGVITFSSRASLVFGLDRYSNSTALIQAVDNIPFSAGGTNTGAALELLRKSGFSNDRIDVPNIAILLTDGQSKDFDATKQQATLVTQAGNTLVTIGIGNDTDQTELNTIASKSPITGQSMVYNVDNYSDLQSLDTVVAALACAVTVTSPPTVPSTPPSVSPANLTCHDTINNCNDYGRDICSDYEPWARAHCNWYCGFCTGGPSTTPAPCKNNLPNCHEYGTYICTEVNLISWTKSNCAHYCGLCGGNGPIATAVTPSKQSTQTPDTVCRNRISNCDEYGGKDMCIVIAYRAWAKQNCNKYCGFCSEYEKVPGVDLSNNMTCPDIMLPKECSMVKVGPDCCPIPQCPAGYVMTMTAPNQLS